MSLFYEFLLPQNPSSYLRYHCQKRGDPEWNTSRYSVRIQPEAHPGDDDQHTARNVDLKKVVTELSFK